MSLHRSVLVAVATFLTVGTTSAFAGCCDWGSPAPAVYAQGCGGCGTAYAPIVYATPIAPAPVGVGCGYCGTPTVAAAFAAPVAPTPYVGGYGCGTCGAPIAQTSSYYGSSYSSYYGTGCGGCGVQAVYTAPAPLYVVNQGPTYSGPGVYVPYRNYAPPAEYAPPPAYPPYLYHTQRYYPGPVYRHAYYAPRAYGPRYYPRPYFHSWRG